MENNLKVTLGYVPDNCKEKEAIEINEFSITYSQNADTCSNRDDSQFLKVSAVNNGCGEDGWYFNVDTIGTHWSVNDPEEITNIINDFKSRMDLNITKERDLEIYEY